MRYLARRIGHPTRMWAECRMIRITLPSIRLGFGLPRMILVPMEAVRIRAVWVILKELGIGAALRPQVRSR